MINIPSEDGMYIRDYINKYRRKHNIPEPEEIKKLYDKQSNFLKEELELITKLRITKKLVPYLDYFPNLTSINITGNEGLSQQEIQSIINRYPNMKELTIEHQNELQYLDVSNLSKLQDLQLISNKGLKNVIGIDKLVDLYGFTFYDNQLYGDKPKDDLMQQVYRISHDSLAECNIDVLYMPDFIKFLEEHNLNLDSVKDYIVWSENLKSGVEMKHSHLEYKTGELYMAYKKARDIVEKYIKDTDTPEQRFAILYQWMCENVKYDYAALDNNHTHTKDGIVQGRSGGTNGTVNALMYGSCVCQGYSKSMQMLLKLAGIYSVDIGCVAEEKDIKTPRIIIDNQIHADESDHSILKVNLNGKIYYSDITWDAGRFQKGKNRNYFLLSKSDILKDHRLLGEAKVFDAGKSVSSQKQEELLKFATERIKQIDQEKAHDTSLTSNNVVEENKINKKRSQQSMEGKKEVATLLSEINTELTQSRAQYGQIAIQIENLMKQNATTPIANYQQQLNALIQQRDALSSKISEQMSTQKTYQTIVDYEKEEAHKATLWQVEQLLGIRITDVAGMEVDPNRFGGVPQALAKDTNVLRQELGNINQQLETLFYDGQLDLKTYQAMKKAVRDEYSKFSKDAPKPIKKEETQQQQQNQSQQTTTTSTTTQQDKDELKREKYGYSDMTEQERIAFDERLERQSHTRQTEKTKDDLISEKQEILRAAWKQKLEEMKKQGFEVPNLDDILRQQEIIEQQRMDTEKLENTGRRMM